MPSVRNRHSAAGFTLIEAIVALSLIGVGIATIISGMVQMNTYAATARNTTGAYTVLMNQIDLFQSMSPFNPQKNNSNGGTPQIPQDTGHGSYPTYDMRVTATPRQLSVNGTDWNVPVYEYMDASNTVVVVVNGALTETITDLSTASPAMPNTYQATFTITYRYRNRNYSYSMSTIRTSDI